MGHYDTTLSQITSLVNRPDFDHHAEFYHFGQKLKSYNRWRQFMAMLMLTISLNELVEKVLVLSTISK